MISKGCPFCAFSCKDGKVRIISPHEKSVPCLRKTLLRCFRDYIHNSSNEWNMLVSGQPSKWNYIGVEGLSPKKHQSRKFQNTDQIKTNNTPHCSMHYPTAEISWMAFTYGNLLTLCSLFQNYYFFNLKPSPEITGAKAMYTYRMRQISKMQLAVSEVGMLVQQGWDWRPCITNMPHPCFCFSQNIGPQNNPSKVPSSRNWRDDPFHFQRKQQWGKEKKKPQPAYKLSIQYFS